MPHGSSDSKTSFCTIDGCGKPRRARGLCIGHYNAAHRTPNPTAEFACAYCGDAFTAERARANRYKNLYCSDRCKGAALTAHATELPAEHWARWYGKSTPLFIRDCVGCGDLFTTSVPTKVRCERHCKGKTQPARFTCGSCVECGASFVAETNGSPIRYCSHRCVRRTVKRRRRAREHDAPGDFTYSQVMRQYQRQGNVCAYCQRPARGLPDPEHVLPLSRGGRNDMSNLVAACRACNSNKGDLTLTEWSAFRMERQLPTVDTTLHGPAYTHVSHDEPTRPSYRLAA